MTASDDGGTRAPQVALVTGAASGIGAAIAHALAGHGMKVVGTDVDAGKLDGVSAPTIGAGGIETRVMDVTSAPAVTATAKWLEQQYGRLDVLVNAAGVFRRHAFVDIDEALMRQVLGVNLEGTLRCTAVFGRMMARHRRGRIIQIASISAFEGAALASLYAAAKAGIIAASKTAARELGPRGVRVNIVAPGYCDTPMLAPERAFIEKFAVPRVPVGRLARAEEVAELVLFLATSETDYMNGSVLTIDGGLRVG